MDIARPDRARKLRRRRIVFAVATVGVVCLVSLGVSRLEPAAPVVDSGSLWSDTVKRGDMVRQVRGAGTLVPNRIQYVQASSEGIVERLLILPGAKVAHDTVLMELSNPELEQALFDARWELEAAEADGRRLAVQLQGERLANESAVASLLSDWKHAELEAQANERLAREELVAELEVKRVRLRADDLKAKYESELKRLEFSKQAHQAQLIAHEATLKKFRALIGLKERQVEDLRVRAGVDGVLQQIGDGEGLQLGRRVGAGTTLAKIVQPTDLKAEIRIPETQARDVQIGQRAEVDTRNGVIPGMVSRVDPAVQNGTVTVDVELQGSLPKGARPDLSVDGTIELELIKDVLFVGRPVHAQSGASASVFKISDDGATALRVPVRFGRTSVSVIEVAEGLDEGTKVILSDVSSWDGHDRIRLK